MTNLAGIVQDAQSARGEWLAMRQGELALTYAELARASGQAAALLRYAGVAPGDRVALMLPNVLAFPVLYYGSARAGGAVVPMNPLLKSREVEHYLGDSGASVVFAWDQVGGRGGQGRGRRGRRRSSGWREPDARTLLGDRQPRRTGRARPTTTRGHPLHLGHHRHPEGRRADPREHDANAEVTATSLLDPGPDDVIMGCLPMFHAFGQTCGLNAAVLGGACLTLIPRFDAGAALKVIERDRVTVFEGVPTMYSRCSARRAVPPTCHAAGVRLRRGRAAGRGAAGVRAGVRRPILEGYGLSETSPVASFKPDRQRKAGLDRHPHRRGGDARRGRGRRRGAPGGGRRDRHPRPQRHEGLLEQAGSHRRGHQGRLVPHRGHGPERRGRLLLHRRPQEGPDHPGRVQRLPARDRGGAVRAPGRAGGGGDRVAAPDRTARRSPPRSR